LSELKQQDSFWKDQLEQNRQIAESKTLELEKSQIDIVKQRDQFDRQSFKIKVRYVQVAVSKRYVTWLGIRSKD